MNAPKDRDALIEVIMRALVRVRVESNLRISDSLDRPGYTPEEIERSIDYALDPEVRDHTEWPAFAKGVLTALESSGCFVGPVVATDKMMVRGGFSFAGRVPNADVFPAVRKLWDDMQSANPYKGAESAAGERYEDITFKEWLGVMGYDNEEQIFVCHWARQAIKSKE